MLNIEYILFIGNSKNNVIKLGISITILYSNLEKNKIPIVRLGTYILLDNF